MRINFEANEALVELIDSLAARTGSTKKGVIVGALQLLQWSMDQRDQGFITAAVSAKNDKLRREYHHPVMIAAGQD